MRDRGRIVVVGNTKVDLLWKYAYEKEIDVRYTRSYGPGRYDAEYEERGHDYFLQCTDARPDTGGLSGATPGEAVSWGKIDPSNLPDCVVCYADSTITLPLITAYALSKAAPRKLKRLYDRRDADYAALREQYLKRGTVAKTEHRTDIDQPKRGRSGRSVTGTKRS